MGPGAVTSTAHLVAAPLALLVASVVLARTKGTRSHVRLGRLYVGLLVLVDVSALLTYEQSGGPGGFHVLAVVSLLTLCLAVLASPRRLGGRQPHAVLMTWSVAGLAAAGVAQVLTAAAPAAAPWPTAAATGAACAVATWCTWHLRRTA